MEIFIAVSAVILCLIFIVLLTSYICFRMTFFVKEKDKISKETHDIPPGKEYEPYREQMIAWQKQIKAMPHESVSIKSFDGLTLRGNFYETQKDAPIELMMHGYRGCSYRDLCGGVTRAFALGHNVLLIDHRASGESEGNIISFGINESKDCLLWIDFLTQKFGQDIDVILTGVSMGAATAMMAIERGLPSCVKGILADCGYSSAKDIIKLVIRKMHLPPTPLYPFVRLGGIIYGKFDIEEILPRQAVKKATVPVCFAHGDVDNFVPHSMSVECFDACSSEKSLITIKGAGHGLCYPSSPEEYVEKLSAFFSYLK